MFLSLDPLNLPCVPPALHTASINRSDRLFEFHQLNRFLILPLALYTTAKMFSRKKKQEIHLRW